MPVTENGSLRVFDTGMQYHVWQGFVGASAYFNQGEGDQKFIPKLTVEAMRKIANISSKTAVTLEKIIDPLFSVPPFNLGYPNKNAQSGYYPGAETISQEEIATISEAMNRCSIGPENTRIQKGVENGKPFYQVLQASSETGVPTGIPNQFSDAIYLVTGDRSEELAKVCATHDSKQSQFLDHYIDCFRTGSLEAFQESQKVWVTDMSAKVENLLGFIEPYRDPAGIRSEWEAMIGIADPDESARLKQIVENSTLFIRQLPWVVDGVNNGKGPFEKSLFEVPDFTIVLALAVCGSIVFEAANLPNYEYICETSGFKNIVLANCLNANNNPNLPCHWLKKSELKHDKSSTHNVRFITTAIHELFGDSTGILLGETSLGIYNFEKENPLISPLSKTSVDSYYLPRQTWTSIFGKLVETVEECGAILVSESYG
ncbi:hypothetical protein HYFRA_00005086 [Hymenoscyphus fraxineus]|uniref:Uncharacterized protein n=1 Tax=Hymenoscyphus fraxineus TaxID=746836 RepID=A0A9N9PPJ2_9HELO|nr:hypothetical protein HYFRA_00005086 [Hymenoscyphus fraxineus]